jgi:DNA-binding transcriptional regulator YhcF (GntR family)
MEKQADKTERVYDFLVEQWQEARRIPSYREIASACELSLTVVIYHLDKLEGQGRIERKARKARSIRLVEVEAAPDETAEQVYQFICDRLEQGSVPTQTEIAAACYLSRTKVRRCLARLEGAGRIILGEGMRDIQLP